MTDLLDEALQDRDPVGILRRLDGRLPTGDLTAPWDPDTPVVVPASAEAVTGVRRPGGRRRQRLGRPTPTTYRTSRAAPGTLSQIHHG